MNKAAFLDILHHVSSISEQEVLELEKLALNFPYCQSAHLLLAKAAYDKGSMLSNQRLRRAAACAANRQLLKKLIYTSGTHLVLEPIADSQPEAAIPVLEPIEVESLDMDSYDAEPAPAPAPAPEPAPEPLPADQVAVLEPIEAESLELEAQEEVLTIPAGASPPMPPEEPAPAALPQQQPFTPVTAAALPAAYEVPDLLEEAEIASWSQQPAGEPLGGPPEPLPLAATPDAQQADYSEDLDDLFAVDYLTPVAAYVDPVTAFVNALDTGEADAGETAAAEEPGTAVLPQAQAEETLPATAPAGPPVAEETDETISQFDQYLFTPEKEQEGPADAPAGQAYQEEIIYKVFDANELGYWMDSSRLGETLVRKNELATAQPYFFRPELLLEYSRHHDMGAYQAPEPGILARQLDIIDQFLKLNPKIKSMANLKIKPESQEDLSLKSTKIRKTMASETLANIMVQQGKIKKAIKIYEHLILKLPEKKDYFVAQIEKLQNIT